MGSLWSGCACMSAFGVHLSVCGLVGVGVLACAL